MNQHIENFEGWIQYIRFENYKVKLIIMNRQHGTLICVRDENLK